MEIKPIKQKKASKQSSSTSHPALRGNVVENAFKTKSLLMFRTGINFDRVSQLIQQNDEMAAFKDHVIQNNLVKHSQVLHESYDGPNRVVPEWLHQNIKSNNTSSLEEQYLFKHKFPSQSSSANEMVSIMN